MQKISVWPRIYPGNIFSVYAISDIRDRAIKAHICIRYIPSRLNDVLLRTCTWYVASSVTYAQANV